MKLKKLIITLLILAILTPSTTNLKIDGSTRFAISAYRHSNAALIEWSQVKDATWYKVYRATKKKGKYTKFKKIGTVSEKWFTKYGDNVLHTRWFVNVCYDGRKKCPQKGHRYNHKKTYKYKIVALKGKDIISKSTIITVKRYKSKKYEPGYDVFYYANKERYKAKKRVLPWGHVFNKAALKRAKDIVFRHKRGDNFDAKNSKGFIYHQRPKERLTNVEKKYSGHNLEIYLRGISKTTLSPCNISGHYENISKNATYGHTIVSGYMNSPGHKRTLLKKEDEYGTYTSYIINFRKFTYEITLIRNAEIIIGTNYSNLATEKERQAQDKYSKVISKRYKPILDNAYKSIQKTANQGFDVGDYLGFTFTKSNISKCQKLYPWVTNDFLNQYFNDTIYAYYKTESYWEYDNNGVEREHKRTIIKPEYKDEVNQLYVDFIKNYARLIPYQ